VPNPSSAIKQLEKELSNRISPPLTCQVDTQTSREKKIIRVLVPRGDDPPYAVDDNKIYIRDEAETGLAVRDEIVQLVRRDQVEKAYPQVEEEVQEARAGEEPPRTGVEIEATEERDGVRYFTMRDLRNGTVVKNVTEKSARRLWHYAISEYTALPDDLRKASISWQGDLGLLKHSRRGNKVRYDLAQKTHAGIRVYFGVTEDGIHGAWKQLVESQTGGASSPTSG
jgi:hypothetical protein